MQSQLALRCKYCSAKATGINYRPRPELQNAPTCTHHRTSLYIPYASNSKSAIQSQYTAEENKENVSATKNEREINNDSFFENLVNVFREEVSMMKKEVEKCEQIIKNVQRGDTFDFNLQCKLTNPYMLLKQDKEMMLNTIIGRIKNKCEVKPRLRVNSGCWESSASRFDNRNSHIAQACSPKAQPSEGLTAFSSRIRSDNGSPINAIQKFSYYKKQILVKDDFIKY